MPKSCIICSAVASPELQLQYCAACQSALYCSKACQRIDWKQQQHKQICKLLNVGHGDRQVRDDIHTRDSIEFKKAYKANQRSLDEGKKQFYKLFEESTFEGSRAVAQKMKKYAKRQTKPDQRMMLFRCLNILIRSSNSEMLSWPNSPLLVMLEFVDPNDLFGGQESTFTLLHHLADLADPFDYSTHVNQLILAKQLIEHGTNVNAVSNPSSMTPLYKACCSGNVTNLDFVEYLLKEGADPNTQNSYGRTPLMYTMPYAPGAAKFLLNWPTTDVNITTRSGASFLVAVRSIIVVFSDVSADPDNPKQVQDQFLLKQWRKIEGMLVEREAADTGLHPNL